MRIADDASSWKRNDCARPERVIPYKQTTCVCGYTTAGISGVSGVRLSYCDDEPCDNIICNNIIPILLFYNRVRLFRNRHRSSPTTSRLLHLVVRPTVASDRIFRFATRFNRSKIGREIRFSKFPKRTPVVRKFRSGETHERSGYDDHLLHFLK